MRILLPPSEGKAHPVQGAALDPGELTFHEWLGDHRGRLLDLLERQGGISRKRAVASLGISESQGDDVDANAKLRSASAAPAAEVYTGVLFERLGFDKLSAAAGRRAEQSVLIASALWGFVAPSDRIPYYRLPAKAKLPHLGGLAGYWRPALKIAMEEAGIDREGELILDLRSGAYTSAWKPTNAELLPVRAFAETGGERKVISHMAKAVRGDAARIVLKARRQPSSAAEVAELMERSGIRAELGDGFLDLISTG